MTSKINESTATNGKASFFETIAQTLSRSILKKPRNTLNALKPSAKDSERTRRIKNVRPWTGLVKEGDEVIREDIDDEVKVCPSDSPLLSGLNITKWLDMAALRTYAIFLGIARLPISSNGLCQRRRSRLTARWHR
jgi:hypothetical protein